MYIRDANLELINRLLLLSSTLVSCPSDRAVLSFVKTYECFDLLDEWALMFLKLIIYKFNKMYNL